MPLESGTIDTTGADIKGRDPVKIARWLAEIELYNRETQSWRERSKRIIRRFKDERSPREDNMARFNVLWANVQTLLPGLYARNPKPDIQRRFKDADPVGRVTSDILERSIGFFVDTDIFAASMRQVVLDYLLPGRGTAWVRYVPHFKKAEALEVTDDTIEGEQDEEPQPDIIDYEEVLVDYVHPTDFGHNICRTYEELYCGWRIVYMTREELHKRFDEVCGEEAVNAIPLDYIAKSQTNDTVLDDGISKATIYELWDKSRKCAVWFHKTIPNALDYRDDPLKLDGFFPFPKPLFANLANDSLIPTPDYIEYQDQAWELDNLTARITAITRAIKVAGAYDASVQALGRILSEGVDTTLIPVESWAIFAEKGGLQNAISLLPMVEVADTLMKLYEARDQVKRDLHEISGIPDIVRGDSDPNETLGAQELKTSFATNRISDRQRDVQRFVRETIRIMVDIMCNHFQLDTIKQISGVRLLTNAEKIIYAPQTTPGVNGAPQQPVPQGAPAQAGVSFAPPVPPPLPKNITPDQMETMLADPSWEDVEQLIRNNALRSFRIDIETDSTIKADQEADKASATEMISAVGGFLKEAAAAGAQQPDMVPVLGQILMFYMRRFPVGKELEGSMQQALTKLEKQAQNPQPKMDPEVLKVQAQAQADQARLQSEAALKNQQMQLDAQIEQHKAQLQAQTDQARAQFQAQVDQHLNEVEAQRRSAELAQEGQLAQMKIQAETDLGLRKAHIQAAAMIEVARVNAKADDGAAAEEREASGE